MCRICGDNTHTDQFQMSRRKAMLGVSGLAAVPLLGASKASAAAARNTEASAAFKARAWGVTSENGQVGPMDIARRAVGPRDVRIDILFAGICHSDIHTARAEWGPVNYPVVTGHEITGRVTAVGKDVTKFKVGDFAGVGCMVDSCGTCANCRADREQNCLNGATFTYGAPDKVSGGYTFGGYSTGIVVAEHFVIRIPSKADLARTTPILCAGVTTFSPMQHWSLEPGQSVGVIGLGGLGHMAVKLAVARGAEVTVFTTSPTKLSDARAMGAKEAVLWSDADAKKRLANSFDLMISTVPESYEIQPFIDLLKLDATLVNVGALGQMNGLSGMAMAFGRKSLAGSLIGGIAETQEVIDYCAARNIGADVEIIRPDQINQAFDRVVGKDVRYRFVIDMAAAA